MGILRYDCLDIQAVIMNNTRRSAISKIMAYSSKSLRDDARVLGMKTPNPPKSWRSRNIPFAYACAGVFKLPAAFNSPSNKKHSIFCVPIRRPKSSRSQSTASPSKNGKGSPPDPDPDPERPVSIGFSVYQIAPAAPPFAI